MTPQELNVKLSLEWASDLFIFLDLHSTILADRKGLCEMERMKLQ